MDLLIDVILKAGRSAVELSFFVLLPVMVVMLSLMRLLEARGVLDWLVEKLAPALRPLGLTGLGVFAALQINFVSFAAPVATLAMMDQRGASSRHLAATLAMVMAMAQANVSMPMAAMGLHFGIVLGWSLVGGLVAAALFGRAGGAALPGGALEPGHTPDSFCAAIIEAHVMRALKGKLRMIAPRYRRAPSA